MKIRYAAKTEVGMKRTHNEDYFSLIEDEQLFIVADGMGGHASGEVASKMAAETIVEFYQLTRDHSLLEDYKEAKPDMTEEEERNFPHKNVITRALGMRETVQVDIRSHQIKSGDVYILCSDGLSGMVADDGIAQIAANAKSLERAVAELVDAANRNGGTDNVTTLLLQCLAA